MIRIHPLTVLLAAAACLGACATVQARFEPWKGLPPEAVETLKTGDFDASKEKLFDAAATALEHEPFLHWSITRLDRADGLISADAGLLREVQLRVSDDADGRSRLSVNVPRRALETRAKVYFKPGRLDTLTAYEPDEAELGGYKVLAADASLDNTYFYSFTYRVLHDRSQVPFELRSYEARPGPQATPVAVDALPQPAPAPQAAPLSPTAGPPAAGPLP